MTKLNLTSSIKSAYSTIDSYLDKAIEKHDATYNHANILAGKVGRMETMSANFWGYFGMYAGQGLPFIKGFLITCGISSLLGMEEYSVIPGMVIGYIAGCNNKLVNLSMKAGTVAGSKTGAAIGKTIDFVFFKDLFAKKL